MGKYDLWRGDGGYWMDGSLLVLSATKSFIDFVLDASRTQSPVDNSNNGVLSLSSIDSSVSTPQFKAGILRTQGNKIINDLNRLIVLILKRYVIVKKIIH